MGIGMFSSCSCRGQEKVVYVNRPLSNPIPSRFDIGFTSSIGRYLVVQVHYPDCTNYEGNKILVYEDVDLRQLKRQKKLDPHFCEGDHYSPIARFEPTIRGMNMAITFCNAMRQKDKPIGPTFRGEFGDVPPKPVGPPNVIYRDGDVGPFTPGSK